MSRAIKDAPPTRLLLATDLSPRGDRALDRAIQLAAQWRAELHLVHAIENELLPEVHLRREVAMRRSEAEALIAPAARHGRVHVHLPVGAAATAVVEIARAKRAGLIVMAPAAYDLLASAVLGSTVERVLRHADQPVLVVKRRCFGPYRDILVAVDLSESSALALRRALQLFPAARFAVVHAFETPFAAFMASAAVEAEVCAAHKKAVAALVATEAKRLGRGAKRPRIMAVVEKGSPDEIVFRQLRAERPDLVVLGTHGLTGIRRAVIGSTAERLIETLPCDVLAVRPPD